MAHYDIIILMTGHLFNEIYRFIDYSSRHIDITCTEQEITFIVCDINGKSKFVYKKDLLKTYYPNKNINSKIVTGNFSTESLKYTFRNKNLYGSVYICIKNKMELAIVHQSGNSKKIAIVN
jgi:hypothetical protein